MNDRNTTRPENGGNGKNSAGGCDRCGKIVVLTKFTLCYDCRRLESIEMDRALEYMKTNKGASVQTIAEATGVDSDMLLRLFQQSGAANREKDLQDKIRKLNPDS